MKFSTAPPLHILQKQRPQFTELQGAAEAGQQHAVQEGCLGHTEEAGPTGRPADPRGRPQLYQQKVRVTVRHRLKCCVGYVLTCNVFYLN